MSSFKTLGLGVLTTSVMAASCTHVKLVSYNPAISTVTQDSKERQETRAVLITEQDKTNPQGVRVPSSNLAVSKMVFDEPYTRGGFSNVKTHLAYTPQDSMVYLYAQDSRMRSLDGSSKSCNECATIPLGHYKDMDSRVQEWCTNAKKVVDSSGVLRKPWPMRMSEREPGVVDVMQDLGGNLKYAGTVDLNNKTIASRSCFQQNKPSEKDYADRTTLVSNVKDFVSQRDKRKGRNKHHMKSYKKYFPTKKKAQSSSTLILTPAN